MFDITTFLLSKKYTDAKVVEIAGALKYMGSKPKFSDLPIASTSNKGHVYTISGTDQVDYGHEYVSDGTQWVDLGADLHQKQDKLIAGANITIAPDGKTISAAGTTYTAGTNIKIENNKISAEAGQLALEGTSGTLTAEQLALLANKSVNILRDTKVHSFSSSTSTSSGELRTYALIIDNNVCPMYHYILVNMLSGVWNAYTTNLQDKLTAGANITIDETTHTISATGGGGAGYFLAEYNKTTFADVLAAYNAGKIIDLKATMTGIGDVILHLKFVQLTDSTPTNFNFGQLILDTASMTLSIDASGWHSTQVDLERELVAGSAIGFDSEIGTARTIGVKYDNNTIKVNSDGKLYTTTAGTSVIANPTLTGDEESLNSIQIGDTKYSNLNYHPFPSSFVINKTLIEFGESVIKYDKFATGCVWYGGLNCTDLPGNLMQVECKVTALRDKTDFVRNIAVVEIFSSNVPPFYWHYNTDSWDERTGFDDWKYSVSIDGSKFDKSAKTTDIYEVKAKKGQYDGWEFYVDKPTDISGKVDKPNEPVAGQGVNVPYYFDVNYSADKATVKDYTIDLLDKSKAPQQFSIDINSATQATAGLMSAADKEKVDKILPKYPTDTTSEYVLSLKYENGKWVTEWKETINKSDVVDKGMVDYMVIKD